MTAVAVCALRPRLPSACPPGGDWRPRSSCRRHGPVSADRLLPLPRPCAVGRPADALLLPAPPAPPLFSLPPTAAGAREAARVLWLPVRHPVVSLNCPCRGPPAEPESPGHLLRRSTFRVRRPTFLRSTFASVLPVSSVDARHHGAAYDDSTGAVGSAEGAAPGQPRAQRSVALEIGFTMSSEPCRGDLPVYRRASSRSGGPGARSRLPAGRASGSVVASRESSPLTAAKTSPPAETPGATSPDQPDDHRPGGCASPVTPPAVPGHPRPNVWLFSSRRDISHPNGVCQTAPAHFCGRAGPTGIDGAPSIHTTALKCGAPGPPPPCPS